MKKKILNAWLDPARTSFFFFVITFTFQPNSEKFTLNRLAYKARASTREGDDR